MAADSGQAASPSVAAFATYFLRLGALGFGGPAALADRMRRDLVESRGWLTRQEFEMGLSLAAACPGPLAYQLAVYCGFAWAGTPGALIVAVAFAAAPFTLVLAVAAAYTRWAGAPVVDAVFYGVSPAVVALIVRACWNLGRKSLGGDAVSWTLAITAAVFTAVAGRELFGIIVGAGAIGVLYWRTPLTPAPAAAPRPARALLPPLVIGLAPATGATSLFLFFFKIGCAVFGSGLVIVPFLRAYVVHDYGWLSDRQFRDAVAVGLVSPGPVVITATFVGYLVGGIRGAAAATTGMFAPAVVFTVVATPIFRRFGATTWVRGFVRGVTSAVVGVLAGTVPLIAATAVVDVTTAGVAAACVLVLFRWRVPEPLIVAGGAIAGLALR